MTLLKIINGGREKSHIPGGKLFLVQSNVSAVACFHWFIFERPAPIAPYDKLIEDYYSLDEEKKMYAQEHVDEFFTEEELEALRSYLSRYNISLAVKKAAIPLPKEQQEDILPMKEIMYRVEYMASYMLSEIHDDYDLPFEGCGAIDLRHLFLSKPYAPGVG